MENIEKANIQRWIATLSSVKHDNKHINVARDVLVLATKPRRQRVAVNLKKLNMYANDSDNVIVPGKVLATGVNTKKFNITAIEYSGTAAARLKAAGCRVLTLEEMLKEKEIKIIV